MVYRSRSYATGSLFGNAGRERIVEPDAQQSLPMVPVEPELTPEQAFALLYVRRAGKDSAAVKVTDAMAAMGMRLVPSAFDVLRARGYLFKLVGAKFHTLTPAGLFKCGTIVRELAEKYRVNVCYITIHSPPNSGRYARCACGWRSPYYTKTFRNSVPWSGAVGRHMDEMRAKANGTWKEPRSVEEIFNETYNRTSGAAAAPQTPHVRAAAPESGAVTADVPVTAPQSFTPQETTHGA